MTEGVAMARGSVSVASTEGLKLDVMVHHPDAAMASRGTVIQAHGITVDMDEGGMFIRLADQLAEAGFTVLRFSFRGHGHSEGTQRGVTIAGEMLDLQAVVDHAVASLPGPLSMVAASFGAVSTILSLPYLDAQLRGVVLWNPVLDLRHTFTEPELPWGLENFGPQGREQLRAAGYLLIDGEFELGRVAFQEMDVYQPLLAWAASTVSGLIIHGDRDSYVSYDIARQAATTRPGTQFHTVSDSGHGFDSLERENEAIAVTVEWLIDRPVR